MGSRTWLIASLMTLLALIEIVAYVVALIAFLSGEAKAERHGWWVEEHAKALNNEEHYGYRESMRVVQRFWEGATKKIDNSSTYNKAYTQELFYLIANYVPTDPKEYEYRRLLADDLIEAGAVEVMEIESNESSSGNYQYASKVVRSVNYEKLPELLTTRARTAYGYKGLIGGLYIKGTGMIRLGYGTEDKTKTEITNRYNDPEKAYERTLVLKKSQHINASGSDRVGNGGSIYKAGLVVNRDLSSVSRLKNTDAVNSRYNNQYTITLDKLPAETSRDPNYNDYRDADSGLY